MTTFDFAHYRSKTWYPGHMVKASRQIKEKLKLVDLVLILVDARIPYASINEELASIIDQKAKVFIMNKTDLANQESTQKWVKHFASEDTSCVHTNAIKKQA